MATIPEAAYRALQIALDYRQEFNKDVVLDVVGFRKLGHNESDEPSYTQPLMYARVKAHPGVRTIYAQRLIKEGVIDEADLNEMLAERTRRLEGSLARAKELVAQKQPTTEVATPVAELDGSAIVETGVGEEVIHRA